MATLVYENLDEETRQLMLAEIAADIEEGRADPARDLYISNYLNEGGVAIWPSLLLDAVRGGDDASLAAALERQGCFKVMVQRRKPKGGFTMAKVPVTAASTLAEAQFNMYYMRALSVRALALSVSLVVYRAKAVENPRTTSEALIGRALDPAEVLAALRATRGVEPPIHIPLPNTGITVRLAPAEPAFGVRAVGE
ncbi:MAG: hypothetical protein M3N05_04820 [Pseudomonadota bacterium]|nr:hypothetical protein [Pseudomonadota bacterium]